MDMNERFEIFWECYGYIFDEYIKNIAHFCQRSPITHDIKDILKGIFWILDSGAQWRKLPKEFPPASTTHKWHQRLTLDGIYDILYEHMLEDAKDTEMLDLGCTFIDGSFIRSKGGHDKVGLSKAGKGSKIMAIVDANKIPISIHIESANPHESKSVVETIENIPESVGPVDKMVGDKAYDNDPLDKKLRESKGIDLIAPHKINRAKEATQDADVLAKHYPKRHKIENFWAQFQWGRRVVVRYEKKSLNFLGFALLRTGLCIMQLAGCFVNT